MDHIGHGKIAVDQAQEMVTFPKPELVDTTKGIVGRNNLDSREIVDSDKLLRMVAHGSNRSQEEDRPERRSPPVTGKGEIMKP
jgi:hypothetical protein